MKISFRNIITAVLAMLLLVACAAPAQEAEEQQAADGGYAPIRIAVAAPLTGDTAEYGQGFLNAANMKADHINAAGGVLGRSIEVVAFDDANSPEQGASIALQISESDIVGVIGHFTSSVAMTAAPIYDENQVVNISPSASHPDFSSIGDFIFRNNSVISYEAATGLDIATSDLGHSRIGVLSILTDWGTSTSSFINDLAASMDGVDIVHHEEVLETLSDFSTAITNFEVAEAEVIIVAGMYSTLAPLMIQYRQINPDMDFIGFSNAYSFLLIDIAGEAAEGLRFPASFFDGSTEPLVADFVNEFQERFGMVPSSLTAQAFDSVGMLLEAIEAAGTTYGPAVRDALLGITYNGVTGSAYFIGTGDVVREFYRIMIQDGQFVQVN